MAALSGREFLERRSAARVHVEIQGQTLTGGVADHPPSATCSPIPRRPRANRSPRRAPLNTARNLYPPALPAVPRDLAQARRLWADGHPDRGRRGGAPGGRYRDLPAVRHARRSRPGQAVPAGVGHLHLPPRPAPAAVWVLLL